MRLQLIAILLSLVSLAGLPQRRGNTASIRATPDTSIGIMHFAVGGMNPCGAVNLDYGDGVAVTYTIRELPVSQSHEYTRVGDYTVRARGVGNCDGTATTSVRITSVRPQPPPPPQQQLPPVRGQQPEAVPRQAIRFAEMDRNGDQIITRSEWNGSSTSFNVHDWNGDGRLSGDEVRVGAPPVSTGRGRQSGDFNDWSDARFRQLDQNRDNRISPSEWRFDIEDFIRVDRNRDNMLSANEFALGDIDDDRGDRFDDLDLNRDNRVDGREWHGSLEAFRWLDRNNDGWLSRFEGVGTEQPSRSFPGWGSGGSSERGVTVVVTSQQSWTDTGITVRAGDPLLIRANGVIQFSGKSSDVAEPDGARGRRATDQAPLPNIVIGALIGRVGNSRPFLVGSDSQGLRAPRDGRLYLGVNDDIMRDNRGEFRVILNTGRGGSQ